MSVFSPPLSVCLLTDAIFQVDKNYNVVVADFGVSEALESEENRYVANCDLWERLSNLIG